MNFNPISREQLKKLHQLDNIAIMLDEAIRDGSIMSEDIDNAQGIVDKMVSVLIDRENTLGSHVYILYEIQALLQWIKGNRFAAFDFVRTARAIKDSDDLLSVNARRMLDVIYLEEQLAQPTNSRKKILGRF